MLVSECDHLRLRTCRKGGASDVPSLLGPFGLAPSADRGPGIQLDIHHFTHLYVFDTERLMPPQVLSTKYIDRKKLAALLNTLYSQSEYSITVRAPDLQTHRADSEIVEVEQLDCQRTCTAHSS